MDPEVSEEPAVSIFSADLTVSSSFPDHATKRRFTKQQKSNRNFPHFTVKWGWIIALCEQRSTWTSSRKLQGDCERVVRISACVSERIKPRKMRITRVQSEIRMREPPNTKQHRHTVSQRYVSSRFQHSSRRCGEITAIWHSEADTWRHLRLL